MNDKDLRAMAQAQSRLDLSDAPWHACEKGNLLYDYSTMFKRVSPLISPTGNEEFAAAEVILCKTCGKIPPFFAEKMGEVPAELKSDCTK
jgi:hypothetical protein